MRSNRLIISLAILGLSSCGNDIDLTILAEPVPIVYGIICPQDSVHEISLKRSFICEDNLLQYTSNPDSNYFYDARVFLETRAARGEILQRIEMKRHEKPPKETGTFVSSPNYVYRCSSSDLIYPELEVYDIMYTLTIDIPGHKEAIFAESIIPSLPDIRKPKPGDRPYKLDLYSNNPHMFVWYESLEFYIEFETRINYLQKRNGEWEETSVSHRRQYNHGDKLSRKVEILIDDEWFYPMLAGKIKDDPEISSRKFKSIDFILKTSDASFYDYLSYEHYVTDLSTNIYTNIVNGLGIFIANNKIEWIGYTLNEGSMNQLSYGKYTKHLNFLRWD